MSERHVFCAESKGSRSFPDQNAVFTGFPASFRSSSGFTSAPLCEKWSIYSVYLFIWSKYF